MQDRLRQLGKLHQVFNVCWDRKNMIQKMNDLIRTAAGGGGMEIILT
jgi:hypothetical protein